MLDVLVVELHDPAIDVQDVALDFEPLGRADRIAVAVDLLKVDMSHGATRRFVLYLLDDTDACHAVIDLEQPHRRVEPLDFLELRGDFVVQRADLLLLDTNDGLFRFEIGLRLGERCRGLLRFDLGRVIRGVSVPAADA